MSRHHPKAIYCRDGNCTKVHEPACEHDELCTGFGWGHDAQLTVEDRAALGLPPTGEISYRKAVRMLRAFRKQLDATLNGERFHTPEEIAANAVE